MRLVNLLFWIFSLTKLMTRAFGKCSESVSNKTRGLCFCYTDNLGLFSDKSLRFAILVNVQDTAVTGRTIATSVYMRVLSLPSHFCRRERANTEQHSSAVTPRANCETKNQTKNKLKRLRHRERVLSYFHYHNRKQE